MTLLTYAGGGAAALLSLGALVRAVWRFNRRLVLVVDAVQELVPNGGGSIKDAVTRTDARTLETQRELCALKRQFGEHLVEHRAETMRPR